MLFIICILALPFTAVEVVALA